MSLVTKTIDSRILGKEMNLAVYHPAVNDSSALPVREVRGKYGVVHKGRYEDYLLDELIPFVDNTFHTIQDRSARYIGGISSGGYTALSIGLRHQELFSKIGGHMPAIDLSYADEDECYFADETMWLKNDPISIAKQTVFDDLQVFLDDGKEDEGQFYRACEKLFQLLRQNGADVQNHLFEGHHSGDYIKFNMETYLRFYTSDALHSLSQSPCTLVMA